MVMRNQGASRQERIFTPALIRNNREGAPSLEVAVDHLPRGLEMTVFDDLEAAFFDSCVATQASIIKTLALLRVFDNYPEQRIQDFINRTNSDTQAMFILDQIRRLEKLNVAI